MTTEFDQLYESIIHEVLTGSKKRNKLPIKSKPGMGRKGGKMRDHKHITAMPRNIKKHSAHIRPVNKTIGNESGEKTKKPDAKPVYSKMGVKPTQNKSQRNRKTGDNPYSSDHFKHGTKLNLAKRREKLLKHAEQ